MVVPSAAAVQQQRENVYLRNNILKMYDAHWKVMEEKNNLET